jgi:hypothetical protein
LLIASRYPAQQPVEIRLAAARRRDGGQAGWPAAGVS